MSAYRFTHAPVLEHGGRIVKTTGDGFLAEFPSATAAVKCGVSVALSADSPDELLDIAVAHAVAAHGHNDSPELRAVLRGMFKDVTQGEMA